MSDEQAHMLVISGILITLGFMAMATTLVTLNNLEDHTLRAQQGAINNDMDLLLHDLNETLQGLVAPGTEDIDDFLNHSETAQLILQEEAARSGIYASVRLNEVPPSETFLRPSRCMGWDPDASERGVIVGWHHDTREAGITGAVYDVHMTTGDRSIRLTHYLRLHQCIQDQVYTHTQDATAQPGEVTGDWADTKGDGKTMNLTETNREPVLQDVSPRIDPESFEIHHWARPANLHEEDGSTAKYVSSNVRNNYVRFGLLAPTGMLPGDELHEPEFEVTAGNNQPPWFDQVLHLQVYYPADASVPTISKAIEPLQTTLETFHVDLSRSPTGNMNWTYEEIVDSKWELTVIGDHNPEREIYVDQFNMTGGMFTSQPYRLNATVLWQEIPSIYTDHELTLRYKIEPGTPDETFTLETRDTGSGGNGTWWSLGDLQAKQEHGEWAWRTFEHELDLLGSQEKDLEFRITDTDPDDSLEPTDQDTLQVDLMRLESRFVL